MNEQDQDLDQGQRPIEPTADSTPEPPVEEQRPSRRRAWLAMTLVAVALGLLWISTEDVHIDEQGIRVENPGEPEDAEAAGKAAPLGYTLKDMHGVDVSLASFKGKVIIVNFWATWCGPCKVEIPDLVALQEQYRDDLVVLGVSVDDTAEQMRPYAAEYKINYPLLVAKDRQDFQDAYGPLWGIPVSVIVGRDGRIAKKHSGIASREQFEREIKALL